MTAPPDLKKDSFLESLSINLYAQDFDEDE